MNNILKIYGLRTSGSNWLQWLLEHNVKDVVVLRNQLAWKHGFPANEIDWTGQTIEWDDKSTLSNQYESILDSIKNEKLINGKSVIEMKDEVESTFNSGKLIHCFIVKHPYSWMDSRINKRNKNLESEIKDWNEKTKSYFDFNYPSKVIISYENLNLNPKIEIKRICQMFGLEMKTEWKKTNNNLTHGFQSNGRAIQLDDEYVDFFKNRFSETTLSKINSLLDTEILKLYNTL